MTTDQLKEIAPNLYEGMSPKKNERRKFVLLPDGLTDQELIEGLEGMYGLDSKKEPWDGTAHLQYDITEKIEIINGRKYIRLLLEAPIEKMNDNLRKFNERVARFRKEQSGEPSENINKGLH